MSKTILCLVVFFCVATLQAAIVPNTRPNITFKFGFDECAGGAIVERISGTYFTMGTAAWVTGRYGCAVQYAGSGTPIKSLSLTSMIFTTYWAHAWIKTTSTDNSWHAIFSGGGGGIGIPGLNSSTYGRIGSWEYDGGWGANYSTVRVDDKKWHMVDIIKKTDKYVTIYIDGVFNVRMTTGKTLTSSTGFQIGGQDTYWMFNGLIDDAFYVHLPTDAQQPSATEIKQIYENYKNSGLFSD